jgi:hypothetical protein
MARMARKAQRSRAHRDRRELPVRMRLLLSVQKVKRVSRALGFLAFKGRKAQPVRVRPSFQDLKEKTEKKLQSCLV